MTRCATIILFATLGLCACNSNTSTQIIDNKPVDSISVVANKLLGSWLHCKTVANGIAVTGNTCTNIQFRKKDIAAISVEGDSIETISWTLPRPDEIIFGKNSIHLQEHYTIAFTSNNGHWETLLITADKKEVVYLER